MRLASLLSMLLFASASLLCSLRAAEPAKKATLAEPSSGKVYTYKTTPQGELQIELFFPADWKAADRRPAIVFFTFGGGYIRGQRSQFYNQLQYFSSRGLVAATADYRTRTKHQTEQDKSAEDARSALRWIKGHANELGVDPERVIASGGSTGGALAAALGALCPVADAADDNLSISPRPAALVLFNPHLTLTSDQILEGNRKTLEAIWPNKFLTKEMPPAILFYGADDPLLEGGEEFARLSAKLGNRAELYVAGGQRHGFFNRSPWTESTLRLADKFLASLGFLQGEPPIPVPAQAELKQAP